LFYLLAIKIQGSFPYVLNFVPDIKKDEPVNSQAALANFASQWSYSETPHVVIDAGYSGILFKFFWKF